MIFYSLSFFNSNVHLVIVFSLVSLILVFKIISNFCRFINYNYQLTGIIYNSINFYRYPLYL